MLKELLVLTTLALSTPAVVDGDTIRSGGILIRLVDYDTPEIAGRCTDEVRRAHLARNELKRLLADNALRFELRQCATANYGRLCAEGIFVSDDKPLAWHMIRKGLGVEYICTNDRCPKRKDWCGDVR